MSRLGDLMRRLSRVLALAERVLEERAPRIPDPALFERHAAFRWDARPGGGVVPIAEPALFDLDDLLGVDAAVARLVDNAAQFVRGLPSNHVLLYGERGTGKSSAVRGLLGRFASEGLRIVEVHKEDLLHLPDVLAALRAAPSQRFLLFCDDLSFDEGEAHYRELKAALEGSLAAPPANVRVVATSNRRHLIPEHMDENRAVRLTATGEVRLGEALEEKLALSDRFGLVLGFYGFDQETYLGIVEHYARKAAVALAPEQLRAEALRFALDRSSRSGRTAKQFVDMVAGREALRTWRGRPGEGRDPGLGSAS